MLKKILILSCGTGEGHNSAARAMEQALASAGAECEVLDVLSFKSEKAKARAASVYGGVIRKAPAVFGMVYKLGEAYDALRLPSPVYSYNAKYADKLYEYICENAFTCVLCAHLFAMEAMTAVRRRHGITLKCYGLLTDYTAIPFYKDTDLDGYFVPCDEAGEQLRVKGIRTDRILCTGIPVDSKFGAAVTKEEARARLALPPDKKIIAVMTGGAGCGKTGKLCARLNRALDETHLIIVFTGRNEKLKRAIDKRFGGSGKLITVAFTGEIDAYMKAADLVISKAGGLSSTEAAVANVPLVHLKAIPGQETANAVFFSERGLSFRADTVKQAVKCAKLILADGRTADAMRRLQRFYIKADSAEIISKIITEGKYERALLGTVYSGRISFGERNVLCDNSEAVQA